MSRRRDHATDHEYIWKYFILVEYDPFHGVPKDERKKPTRPPRLMFDALSYVCYVLVRTISSPHSKYRHNMHSMAHCFGYYVGHTTWLQSDRSNTESIGC